MLHRATRNGACLSDVPHRINSTKLSCEEFRDNIRLRYGLMPQDKPATFDGYGKSLSIEHALSCPKGGLVIALHDEPEKDWGALGAQDLIPSAITYKPKINSRTVQGKITGAGVWQEKRTADGGMDTVGEAQGGRGRTGNGATRLLGQPGQVEVPAESRSDVSAHSLWKRGTTLMFDILLVNLDVVFYLHMTPEKALAKTEKEKKDLYPQAFLGRRSVFTLIV